MSILYNLLENISWTTAILILALCIASYVYIQWSEVSPGPIGLPYLGYYPFLRTDYHVQLQEMTKKYGDVFCLRCTGQLFVHLGTVKAIKEAHVTKSDCFGARTSNSCLFTDTFSEGVGFSNGEKWKVLRKFFVHRMKELGMGRETQESLIADGQHRIMETLEKSKGRNVDVLALFTEISTEAIRRLLVSEGSKVDDDEIIELIENFKCMTKAFGTRAILLIGPLYNIMLHVKSDLRKYRKCQTRMESILHEIVRRHDKEFSNDNIESLVDFFISERKALKEKGNPNFKILTDSALVSTILQFLGDGSLTTGFLIAIILKELSRRPDVQKEIQRELDEVVGANRLPLWDDRSRTEYTNAVIYEITRTCQFFPIFPSLECTKETTIGGCRVPKGTITLLNFWAALRDPEVYEQPEKFDPSRFFLNEEKKPRSEIPFLFGIGKRSCIGEPLVNMEIFLFVTTVLQNFTLHPDEEDEKLPPATKNALADEDIFLRATPRKA